MSGEMLIYAALGLPLLTAVGIFLAGKVPNARESVTILGAAALFSVAIMLAMGVADGAPAELTLGEAAPGLTFAFKLEPLGALFAMVASGLWIVNSFYSIGYMRGNKEKKQTRFYVMFAVSLAAATGIAFSANLFTLFLFYEMLTLSTYPLVSHKGDPATVRSARVYLGILISASIGLMLPAIVWTYAVAGTGDFTAGGILRGHVDGPEVGLLLGLGRLGLGSHLQVFQHVLKL